MNDNALISTVKQNLQNHLNVPPTIIVLFYYNTELFDNTTILLYKIENNIHLNVKCKNSKKSTENEIVNDEKNIDK